jgi:hypothetical protein
LGSVVVWVLIGLAAAAAVSLLVGLAFGAVLRQIGRQTTQLLEFEELTSASSGELEPGTPEPGGLREDSPPVGVRRRR